MVAECYARSAVARRVLYLIDSLGMGGAERGLVLTLKFLDRERYEPEVAFLWEPDLLASEIEALGVRVHRLGARRGDWSLLAIGKVRKLLKGGRFDLLHTSLVWSAIVGRTAGELARVKVVSHIANADPEGWDERVLAPKAARRAKIVAGMDSTTGRLFVDRFVAISAAAKARPIRGSGYAKRKISVVERGQDLEDLAHRASLDPEPPVEDPGSPSLLTVGRLAPQKGQRYLIDAMPRVLEEFPKAKLLVAGDGSLHRMLADRAVKLGDRIEFLGIRRDVPALLARADLFVFPSLWEGQGNALVEAMAVGPPIVATRIPAVLDTVRDGETAALARPGDPGALAEAMLRVLRDPAAGAAMAERAHHEAARFDIHDTTDQLMKVYDEVLGR